jgi:hypothetical protein
VGKFSFEMLPIERKKPSEILISVPNPSTFKIHLKQTTSKQDFLLGLQLQWHYGPHLILTPCFMTKKKTLSISMSWNQRNNCTKHPDDVAS